MTPENPELSSERQAAVWQAVEQRLGMDGYHRPSRQSWRRVGAWAGASTVAVLLLLTVWVARRPAMAGHNEYKQMTTGPGERSAVTFSDGSRIILATESRLRYVPVPHGRPTEVQLDGQAYFDLVHDSRAPFVVRTGNAVVRDVGTAFEVSGYPDATPVSVIVARGAVAIRDAHTQTDATTLTANDQAQLTPDGHLTVWRARGTENTLTWLQGKLVFADTPLREVALELGRWYGVEFRLADSTLANRRLTATFDVESLPEALDILELALHVAYERDGHVVTLHPSATRRPSAPPAIPLLRTTQTIDH